jgi:integrase
MRQREVTDKTLQSLRKNPAKAGERYDRMDSEVRGLGFRVNERGEISYILIARYPGHSNPVRRTIGHYPSMPLAVAREKAKEWRDWIKGGNDPRAEEERLAEQRRAAEEALRAKRRTEEDNTFGAVAEAFIADAVIGTNPEKPLQRTGHATAREIRKEFVSIWGSRPVADIVRTDVTAFLKAKKRTAPGQARNLLGHLKCLFAWAINDGSYGLTGSPCHDIKAKLTIGAKQSGDRVLTDDELRAFWRATGRMRYPVGALYRLLLLSGVRLNEGADASWPELDFTNHRWTIPAARMKAKNSKARPHVVPLTADLSAILDCLPRFKRGEYLFTTTNGAKPIWVNDKIKKKLDHRMLRTLRAIARVRGEDPAKVRLARWVNHDLRRTLRSGLARLRIDDDIAESVLAHVRPGIAGIYDRYHRFDEKKLALERWGAEVRRLVSELPPADNVVALVRA